MSFEISLNHANLIAGSQNRDRDKNSINCAALRSSVLFWGTETKVLWWEGKPLLMVHVHAPLLQEIIQQLIDNSSTFRDKTEFSQQKYIKKKKKKYVLCISIPFDF